MKNNSTITVAVCGGHVTPAIAVIDAIRIKHPDWQIILIGRIHALEGESVLSQERIYAQSRGVQFVPIITGRLQRRITFLTIFSLLKIPGGFSQALSILKKYQPQIVVSFGGYVSFPVVLAAWIKGIPIIMHEQTRAAGLSNKILSRLARKICVSYRDTCPNFSETKCVWTGLPLRSSVFAAPKGKPPGFLNKKQKILYITGGSTGSLTLNDLVFPLIPVLVKDYLVVHQTGELSRGKAQDIRAALGENEREHYVCLSYFDESLLSRILHRAYLVISRAGANTVYELAALGKVSLLIPLPWSASNEQYENARYFEKQGFALLRDQNELTSQKLFQSIETIRNNYQVMSKKAKYFSQTLPKDGAFRLLGEIEKLL